jgi:transcriptional regulator with XRE-family HTH domain
MLCGMNTPQHAPTDLMSEVRALLDARRSEWEQIAQGSQVSLSWVQKFVRGEVANPGYLTLTDLRNFMLYGASPRRERRRSATAPAEVGCASPLAGQPSS